MTESAQAARRPGPLRRVGYLLGKPLPAAMRDWVAADITGPGNARRYFLRGLIPFLPIAVGLCFIPAPWWLRLGMVLLLAIPLLYFQVALKQVYRRHLLRNNGLDPKLADTVKVVRLSEVDAAYRAVHRPPPREPVVPPAPRRPDIGPAPTDTPQ